MQLYSRHLIDKGISLPHYAVIRVNFAWYRKGMRIPKGYDLFFDYPFKRRKPPQPEFTLGEAIELASKLDVKYFAISNAEDDMESLRKLLPDKIKLVPKIETMKGIDNLKEIVEEAETNLIMLDTDDLYLDSGSEYKEYLDKFNKLVKFSKFYTDEIKLKVLRTGGVVFCDY